MIINFWGARGSIPVSGKDYNKYGGDTACVEIRPSSGEIVVIDAGTGIRRLGKKLAAEKAASCQLFFTHSHWDHVMGFPFFQPIYQKGFKVSIKGCSFARKTVKDIVSKTMEPPNFPVKFEEIAASIDYAQVCTDETAVGSMKVRPVLLSHPNDGTGYKFTENGASFVFLTDNELGFRHPGGLNFDDYVEACKGAELLVHDAEFTPEEYKRRKTWGHSTYVEALELALRAGVKKLGLYHHNQDRTDAEIDAFVADCKTRAGGKLEVFAVGSDTSLKVG